MASSGEQIKGLASKINEKNPYYLIFGAWGLIFVAVYFGVFNFQISLLSQLNEKITVLSQQWQSAQTNVTRQPQYRKQVQSLKERLSDVNSKIHSREEVPMIVEKISRMANDSGVKIQQILANTSTERSLLQDDEGEYFTVPILLEAQSDYHSFGAFLNQLEGEQMFLFIPSFAIAADQRDSLKHAFKMTLDIIIFEKTEEDS